MEKKIQCPYCSSQRIWKSGKIPIVNKGKRQRYKCAECGKTFYGDES